MKIPGRIKLRGGVLWYFGWLPPEVFEETPIPRKRLRISLFTTDRAIAEAAAEERYPIERAVHRKETLERVRPTVHKLFYERFLPNYLRRVRNAAGVITVEGRFRYHIDPVIGHKVARAVTTEDLRLVLARAAERTARRKETTLSPTTQRHVAADLRTFFGWLKDEAREIIESPWRPSLMPQAGERDVEPLTDDQVRLVLEEARPHEAFCIRTALLTGMRWNEIRTLHRGLDVRWEPVPHFVLRSENTKSRKQRVVVLIPEMVAILEAWLAQHQGVMVSEIQAKNPCWFVGRIAARVGFHWHFHQLRHTFDTRAQLAGLSPTWVGAMSGQGPATVGRYTSVQVLQLAAEVAQVYASERHRAGHNPLTLHVA